MRQKEAQLPDTRREGEDLTTGSPAGGPVLISMRFSGSSSSGASSGITTTGLMCSASAEARKKLGGPWGIWGDHVQELLVASGGSPPQLSPEHSSPPPPQVPRVLQVPREGTRLQPGGRRYLGQPGDLDEPLEVEHVRGSAEEVSEAAGQMRGGHGGASPARQPRLTRPQSILRARIVPVKLLVEPVPVALQGVRWET